ncbi:MAG: GAF domain-containing protein [Desulfobacterales bacterium]|nr:GAF domain-containing protein [Desulfobacterales bacterium]
MHRSVRTGEGNRGRDRSLGASAPGPGLGPVQRLLIGFLSPAAALCYVLRRLSPVRRARQYCCRKLGPGKLEVRIPPGAGAGGHSFSCPDHRGLFEEAGRLSGIVSLEITPSEWPAAGEDACCYLLCWQQSPVAFMGIAFRYGALFLGMAFLVVLPFYFSWPIFFMLLLSILSLVLGSIWHSQFIKKQQLRSTLADLHSYQRESLDMSRENYERAHLQHEVGRILGRTGNIQEMVDELAAVLADRLKGDRGQILVVNRDRSGWAAAVRFDRTRVPTRISGSPADLLCSLPDRGTVAGLSFAGQRSFVVNDLEEIRGTVSERCLAGLADQGVRSFICSPVVVQGESLGVLFVENSSGDFRFLEKDLSLLQVVATVLGQHIHHYRLRDLLQ